MGAITLKANPGLRLEAEAPGLRPKRVLLLEDDAAFKEIMTTFINENGYDVVAVQSGYECGLVVDGFTDVQVGDNMEFYRKEKVERTA